MRTLAGSSYGEVADKFVWNKFEPPSGGHEQSEGGVHGCTE